MHKTMDVLGSRDLDRSNMQGSNEWHMDFPYPVGRQQNTSLQFMNDWIASICFDFNIIPIFLQTSFTTKYIAGV